LLLNFLLRMLLTFGLFGLIDVYAYQAFKTALGKSAWLKRGYWGVHILLYVALLAALLGSSLNWGLSRNFFYWLFTFSLLLYIPKILAVVPLLLLEDLGRLFQWLGRGLRKKTSPSATSSVDVEENVPTHSGISRRRFLSQASLALGVLPFAHLGYGILKGRYQFRLRKVQVPIPNLPPALQGFTITQLSDIHVGSFDDVEAVRRGIEMANAPESDLIVFTGDLINNEIEELKPEYKEILGSLSAPMGVYSVLGNHDYGDYGRWPSEEAKRHHFQRVVDSHAQMGWRLLKNQHDLLEVGGHQLALIGVENWGANGFTKYGDLEAALTSLHPDSQGRGNLEEADVRVLLSHDPSHWKAQVLPHAISFNLTLSGHTHGMQYGVEVPALGIKWSPIKWRYPEWAGLYQGALNQHLYVNRGFGHLAFMGRAGIFPEVSVLELVSA
jgi:predicted MPP superfamily phosphohydrolase